MTEAAEKLDYHLPKQRIRRSAKSRKLLVVFCPTLTNPYYVMLLQGIEAMAKEYGYGVFVCNTQEGSEDRGKLSADDAGSAAAGNHLCL